MSFSHGGMFFFSYSDIQQRYFKYFRVNRDPGKWLDFNLTFVGFMIFLGALIQTTTCQSIDHCICHRQRGVGERRLTETDFCQNFAP